MSFSQKIYYQNKPLILTNDAEWYIYNNPLANGYLISKGAFPRNYRISFQHLDKLTSLGAIIQDLSIEALQAGIHEMFTPIDAAGGVVTNDEGDVLMIYRRGKWDLPKGKLDHGEELKTCAVREVKEETGLDELSLEAAICDTFHIYRQKGDNLLKRTAWYAMKADGKADLHPQAEENIEAVRWIPREELGPIVFKSYKAIGEVLQQAGITW